MSDANVQMIRKAYADFSNGNVAAILAALDPNVEWTVPGDFPESGTWRGPLAVSRFFEKVAATWNFTSFEPLHYIASGDRVIVLGTYVAKALSTGGELSSDWAMAWTIRDGRITHFKEYTDTLAG